MNRRKFIKRSTLACGAVAFLPGRVLAQTDKASDPASSGGTGTGAAGKGKSKAGKIPDYAKDMLTSDMNGLGPDGKPTGQKATFTGASKANAVAEKAMQHKMKLTKQEQAILEGKDGEEKAKLMKILVKFGNAFGAEKLVDLGGAPHSNMFIGAPYMASMIKMLDACAKAGLKSYAPYTVNPRPYDVYNVQNNAKDMTMIYEGYSLQWDLDYVHVRLGAPDLNYRTCACYLDEVGNAPDPGTYVAWAESSAVNYGNSVLGIRTNRNGAGMVEICAMLGKTPLFGLMTDEGRMAKWLIDVKTTKEPDWGVLGGAIGVVENAYDETCRIAAVPVERLFDEEEQLLALAKSHLPRLPFRELDLLVVRQIGWCAIARKVIILDIGRYDSLTLVGVAALISAVALAFLVIKRYAKGREKT